METAVRSNSEDNINIHGERHLSVNARCMYLVVKIMNIIIPKKLAGNWLASELGKITSQLSKERLRINKEYYTKSRKRER